MANTTLYYDQDDKVLWISEGTKRYPVYTYANFNPKNIRLDQGEYLQVIDSDSGEWIDVVDNDGKKVSLKGADGKNWENDKSLSIYHLELSNDMDQVYVDENNIILPEQDPVTSIISIYENGALIDSSDWDISVTPEGDSLAYNCASVEDNVLTVNFNQSADDIVLSNSQLIYVITCTHKNDDTIILTKQFKLKRICGNIDYDLRVSRGTIKLQADGSISTPSQKIDVTVRAKTIGPNSSVSYISPSDFGNNSKYFVTYQWSNNGTQGYEFTLSEKTLDISNHTLDENDSLHIYLKYKNGADTAVMDEVVLECVKDGIDGTSFAHIELSDDFNQIFTSNGVIIAQAPFTTEVCYFVGNTKTDLNPEQVTIQEEIEYCSVKTESKDDKTVLLTLSPNEGVQIPDNVLSIKIPIEIGEVVKTYTLQKLSGTKDYDLWITPDYFLCTYDADSNITGLDPTDGITIKITEKEVSSISTPAKFVNELPSGYRLEYTVDGMTSEVDSSMYSEYDGVVAVIPNHKFDHSEFYDSDPPRKITISLYNEQSQLVDFSEVAILRDGKKGDKGEDGASAYYLDVYNDFDQLYRYNGEILPGQIYESEFDLYKGASIVSINNDGENVIEVVDCPYGRAFVTQDGATDTWKVRIEFTENGDSLPSFDPSCKSLAYKLHVKQHVENDQVVEATKVIRIAVMDSAEDFDLHLSQSSIKRDGNGSLVDHEVYVSIKHRDLTANGQGVNVLTTYQDMSDKKLTLLYSIDDDSFEELTGEGYNTVKLGYSQLNRASKYITLQLKEGGIVRDEEKIIVVKDGVDSKPLTINLTNDIDQVYINENSAVVSNITLKTVASLYEGASKVDSEYVDYQVSCITEGVKTGKPTINDSGECTLEFQGGDKIDSDKIKYIEYEITCTNTETGDSAKKRFKVLILIGVEDYDLHTSTQTIRVDKNGNFKTNYVRVYVNRTGFVNEARTASYINWTEAGHVVKYTVNGKEETSQVVTPTDGGTGFYGTININSSLFANQGDHPVLYVYLYKQLSKEKFQLVDQTSIEVYYDGQDGQDGKDGRDAAGYTVDFSNDSDQVYVDDNGKLYNNQSITSDIYMFKGSRRLIAGEEYTLDIINDDEVGAVTWELLTTGEGYRMTIKYDTSTIPPGTGALYYTVTVYNEETFKEISTRYRVPVIKSNIDYDLVPSISTIKLSNDGTFYPDTVTCYVSGKKLGTTNVSQNDATSKITSKTGLDNAGLKVKYAVVPNSVSDYSSLNNLTTVTNSMSWTLSSLQGLDRDHHLYIQLDHGDITDIDHVKIDILEDGHDAVLVDLSNDSEQLYFDAYGKLAENATIKTTVQAIRGSEKLTLGSDFYVKYAEVINGTEQNETTLTSNAFNTEYTQDTLTTECPTSIVFYFYSDSDYTIQIGQKELTLIHLQNEWDYDLKVPQSIVADSDGNIKNDIQIKLSKRQVGQSISTSEETTTVPTNYQVLAWVNQAGNANQSIVNEHSLQNQSEKVIPNISKDKDGLAGCNQIIVRLVYRKGTTAIIIDEETIPVYKEAAKGDASTTISVVESQPIIWINDEGQTIQQYTQNLTYKLQKNKGGEQQSFNDIGVIPDNSEDFINYAKQSLNNDQKELDVKVNVSNSFTYTNGQTYSIPLFVDGITINLSAIAKQGYTSYDLKCTPACIKYNTESAKNKYETVKCRAYKKITGGNLCEESQVVDLTGSGLSLSVEMIGSTDTVTVSGPTTSGADAYWTFTPSAQFMHEVELKHSGAIVDYDILPLVKDGANGTLEANVFEVKNDKNTTTVAGLNGKTDSDALLWGGGTYNDAKNAAITENNYKKDNSEDQITTLIKKDGTGKIGPFQIGTDRVALCQKTSVFPFVEFATGDLTTVKRQETTIQCVKYNSQTQAPGVDNMAKAAVETAVDGSINLQGPSFPFIDYLDFSYTNKSSDTLTIENIGIDFSTAGIKFSKNTSTITCFVAIVESDHVPYVAQHKLVYQIGYVQTNGGPQSIKLSKPAQMQLPSGWTLYSRVTVTNMDPESININSYLENYKIILEGEATTEVQRFGVSPNAINYTKLPSPAQVANPGDFFISKLNSETEDSNKAAGEFIFEALDDIYNVLVCLVSQPSNATAYLEYLSNTLYEMKARDCKIVCHNS